MFEQLSSSISNFEYIIHIADIHIRLTKKRHKEYLEVFNKFYEDVDKSPENTIICCLGDVLHSKCDLTPECIQMTDDFLINLAKRREVILIAGNHDCTVNNRDRLDSLTALVDESNYPRIHYLKESKLYGIGNILFNNMSIFEDPEKYIRGINIPEIYKNTYKHIIALFHGPVDNSITYTGFRISNPTIMPELFDWHHLALLGDIHKRQNIQESNPKEHKPTIHYCGSMIMQNHGESINGHGYTLWNLSNYTCKYVDIKNNFGYFTIDVNDGKVTTDLKNIPTNTYLRLKYSNTTHSQLKSIEADISGLTKIIETSQIKLESEGEKKLKETHIGEDILLSKISDVNYQKKLIEDFLDKKLDLKDKTKIDKILSINEKVNLQIKKDDFPRNLKWVPIKLEWSNMFCYGEENCIDFSSMNGVYGIFGPNVLGKSSIFAVMSFCLFDKWDKGFKAISAKNASKSDFSCKFEFSIENVHYFIEKIGETTSNGNVRVNVKFWRNINGKDEDLTDIMRRKTNDVIKEYIGTFEDFILTTLSIQNITKNNISFIDMGNTERKDLLVQFIGLNIFDRLYDEAYTNIKELTIKLKPHKEKNYSKELLDIENALSITESTINECTKEINNLSKKIKDKNGDIVSETSKLIRLDPDVPMDVNAVSSRRNYLYVELNDKKDEIEKNKTKLIDQKIKLDEINVTISKIDSEELITFYKKYRNIKEKLDKKLQELEIKKVKINAKLDKLDKLKQHKYDPNCKFCIENIFVKDARKTEKELVRDNKERDQLNEEISLLKNEVLEWNWIEDTHQNYIVILNNHSKLKDLVSETQTKILLSEKEQEKISQTIKEIERKIELYHQNEISVENNQKVNSTINIYKSDINKLEAYLNVKNKQLMGLTGNKEVLKKRIEDIRNIISDITLMEEEKEIYDYYCKSVGRNGIPYQIICNIIPKITQEINNILTQVTNFTIEIESDEKNIIPYVNYETSGKWAIESISGFERFIVSLAIRIALNNITNLPRSNFIAIDEGWGSLDKINLSSVGELLSILSSHYDFVIIISHLDALRDLVENQIEITKINGISKVIYPI